MSVYLGAAFLALAGALVFQRHKSPSKYEQNGILDSQPTMLGTIICSKSFYPNSSSPNPGNASETLEQHRIFYSTLFESLC